MDQEGRYRKKPPPVICRYSGAEGYAEVAVPCGYLRLPANVLPGRLEDSCFRPSQPGASGSSTMTSFSSKQTGKAPSLDHFTRSPCFGRAGIRTKQDAHPDSRLYPSHPWGTRLDKLYGNYIAYNVLHIGAKNSGVAKDKIVDIRQFVVHNVTPAFNSTVDIQMRHAPMLDHMRRVTLHPICFPMRQPLADEGPAGLVHADFRQPRRRHKYLAVIDGIGATNRLLELLPLGSLIFKA